MIGRKEINLHMYSVFALILVFAIFFLLGGGADTTLETSVDTSVLNLSIPEATDDGMAEDRLEATKRERQKSIDEERVVKLQHNSFDMFKKDSSPSRSGVSRFVSPHSSGNRTRVSNINKNNSGEAVDVNNSIVAKVNAKEKIMRRKRAQLERELGINLSDYGYDKYGEEAESNDVTDTVDKRSLVLKEEQQSEKGFFGLDTEDEPFSTDIKAVIHGDHNDVTSGSVIKIRLLEPVDIDGIKVPSNTFVYGRLSFRNGRANIQVQNINYRSKILKFKASIFDTDGFEGLYVPDNAVSDTKNKIASDVVGGIDVDISSKSKFINTATSSVVNTVKNAIQGSVKEAKISISSNYAITIKRVNK